MQECWTCLDLNLSPSLLPPHITFCVIYHIILSPQYRLVHYFFPPPDNFLFFLIFSFFSTKKPSLLLLPGRVPPARMRLRCECSETREQQTDRSEQRCPCRPCPPPPSDPPSLLVRAAQIKLKGGGKKKKRLPQPLGMASSVSTGGGTNPFP